jgi:hypothetical protein
MIKRVLCLGCSFTHGDELTKRLDTAWPYLLAKQNNWGVINQGKGAGSNDRIVRVAFEEIENNFDLIIVGWTSWDRFEVAQGDISHFSSQAWAKEYFKHAYDNLYALNHYLRQIILLQSYFKQRNQKYVFCNSIASLIGYENNPGIKELSTQVDSEYFVGWPTRAMVDWQGDCPKGPGGHPLELGHQRIAERINEHIRHLGWIS